MDFLINILFWNIKGRLIFVFLLLSKFILFYNSKYIEKNLIFINNELID